MRVVVLTLRVAWSPHCSFLTNPLHFWGHVTRPYPFPCCQVDLCHHHVVSVHEPPRGRGGRRGKQLGRVQRSMLDRPLQRVVDYLCRLVFCCVLFFLGCVLLGLASHDLPLVSFSASPPAATVPPNLAAAAAALSIFGRNLPAVLSVSPTVGRNEGIAMEMTCTERQLCILLS